MRWSRAWGTRTMRLHRRRARLPMAQVWQPLDQKPRRPESVEPKSTANDSRQLRLGRARVRPCALEQGREPVKRDTKAQATNDRIRIEASGP